MSYYATRGLTLQQRLDAIYDEYGYSTEVVFARDYEGSAGKRKMEQIMASLRDLKAEDVLGSKTLLSTKDLLAGKDTGFPPSDVLIMHFTSGEKLVVRPSGTEPKIKYYLFVKAEKGEIGRASCRERV